MMKLRQSPKKFIRKAYTLVELSAAMLVGMIVAASIMALLNFQLQWQRIFAAQNFVLEEAPVINNLVNRLFNQADSFKIYNGVTAAENGTNLGVNDFDGRAVVLRFSDAETGQNQYGMLAMVGQTPANINYYALGNLPPNDANSSFQTDRSPTFVLSRDTISRENSRFIIRSGLLQLDLGGINGELITYTMANQ